MFISSIGSGIEPVFFFLKLENKWKALMRSIRGFLIRVGVLESTGFCR